MKVKKMAVPIAISVMMVAVIFTVALTPAMADPSDVCKDSIRLYGTFGEGAGNHSATDTDGNTPENAPYTDPEGAFFPQHDQAPVKDFMTFNPAIMTHNDRWDLGYAYPELSFMYCDTGLPVQQAQEKVFKRMWYEKEWFKDENGNGEWDVIVNTNLGQKVMTIDDWRDEPEWRKVQNGWSIVEHNNVTTKADIYGPAIIQEFTYMFLNEMTMPTMIKNHSRVLIPMAHNSSLPYRGLNSFDMDGDGVRDYLRVESENTVGIDIDQDGDKDMMEPDGTACVLNGNESLVLTAERRLKIGDEIQFFDHKVKLLNVYGPDEREAEFLVSDNEGGSRTVTVTLMKDDVETFLRADTLDSGTVFYIKQGAIEWSDVNPSERAARIEVGRLFGKTHANTATNIGWNQKAFFVDNVFYNVVAIRAEDDCVKYITFRQKLPKFPIKIFESHLAVFEANVDILPEMAPFCEPHLVLEDVLDYQFTPGDVQDKIGLPLDRPRLEITYVEEDIEERFMGSLLEIYNETCVPCEYECECECPTGYTLNLTDCSCENDTGNDKTSCLCPDGSTPMNCMCPCDCGEVIENETWVLEWFHTYPHQYTSFVLPAGERVLVTLAWYADEAETTIWNGNPDGPLANYTRDRVKFWYDDCRGPIYIDNATDSIRIYGTFGEGAGNHSATDPTNGNTPENAPYTDPEGAFFPQHDQAPMKDFMTFNPAIMTHNGGYPELSFMYCDGLSVQLAKEKVFKRMWYEKEWFKDEDGSGSWDVIVNTNSGQKVMTIDDWRDEPEWRKVKNGWSIVEHNNVTTKADIYGPAIIQEFTYMFLNEMTMPTMIKDGSRVLIPMAHNSTLPYRGLNSFDMDGDGVRDYLRVESENTVNIDIDQDGDKDMMEPDGTACVLNGNESLVLTAEMRMKIDDEIQFFDHKVKLEFVYGPSDREAQFLVSDNEGGSRTVTVSMEDDDILIFQRAEDVTSTSNTGVFYIKVTAIEWSDVNPSERAARIEVGRLFGNTHANTATNIGWNQKAFFVDNVFYNVVAIRAEGDCVKYITFRQKLPKFPIKIFESHLAVFEVDDILPEMAPFCEPHTILVDILSTQFTPDNVQEKIGLPLDRPRLEITYVEEDIEERFMGSLLEIYNETCACGSGCTIENETWVLEWFHTYPHQYTSFVLPDGEFYLMTLAWDAPEAETTIWNADSSSPLMTKSGDRAKFWYDPADPTDIYINRIDGEPEAEPALCGDVNDDGNVNTLDVTTLFDHVTAGSPYESVADVNGDGSVNTLDVTTLFDFVTYGAPALNCP